MEYQWEVLIWFSSFSSARCIPGNPGVLGAAGQEVRMGVGPVM